MHFQQCLVYTDMNMVRAGVVTHSRKWEFGGYNQIQKPRKRYSLIDHERLRSLAGSSTGEMIQAANASWVDEAIRARRHQREAIWTRSLAVGRDRLVEKFKKELGYRARSRRVKAFKTSFELREPMSCYKADFDADAVAVIPGDTP